MATVTLTVRYLDSLHSHGKRFEVFDALVPGLAVRVSASGRKSFTLYYRHQGRMRRLGLGRYPDVLLERRGDSRRSIAGGFSTAQILPATSRPSKRRTSTPCRRSTTSIAPTSRRRSGAGPKCAASWSAKCCRSWRHRRVVDLHRRDIRELVERKARTAPIQANRVLQRISAMLSFAVDQDWSESNPAWRIKKPGRERSRDRVLTREELRELWATLHETDAQNADGTPKPRLSHTLNDVFLVMLLTAQRCGEVCQMQWSEVDLTTGWWAIPGEVSKNHDPHRVPLTAMASRF